MSLIVAKKVSFPKDFLNKVDILASIDRGCSLTKIVYLDNSDRINIDNEISNDRIMLTFALFNNNNFDESLYFLKENAYFPENKTLPIQVTGAGGIKHSKRIKEILERDVIFIDEYLCQARGTYFLLKYASSSDILYENIEPDCKESLNAPFVSNVKNHFEEMVKNSNLNNNEEDVFPCIFAIMGSGSGCMRLNSDGTFEIVSKMYGVGKPFIGLCRCILGTNNYDEIMTMAASGDRRNVDTTTQDIVLIDSPYGKLPGGIPLIPLGKLSETNEDISKFNKNDIAHSLVSLFIYNAMINAIHACISEKIKTVFFGGNLFQGEIFRKEFSNLKKLFNLDFVNFNFISNGHSSALGAMLSLPNEIDKYMKMN